VRTSTWACLLLALLLPALAATSNPSGEGATELPGVSPGTITPETLFAFTSSIKMIDPPAGMQQKWFSSEAEFVGTVATATASSVVVVEPMVDSEHAGRSIRISGSSPAAGQIRQIASNSSDQIDITVPFDVLPEAGDSVEIFTGSLPPGRWDGACTQADQDIVINGVTVLGHTNMPAEVPAHASQMYSKNLEISSSQDYNNEVLLSLPQMSFHPPIRLAVVSMDLVREKRIRDYQGSIDLLLLLHAIKVVVAIFHLSLQ